MTRKRKHRVPGAARPYARIPALIFNAALIVGPMIAAQTVATAFGGGKPQYEATASSISSTRQAIEDRFARLAATAPGEPREVWAEAVRGGLEAGDITAVRGLLLAAPAMLRGPDAQSLRARIAVSDVTGEEALIQAALVYLPDDVQESYLRENAPIDALFTAGPSAAAPAGAAGTGGAAEPGLAEAALAAAADEPAAAEPASTGRREFRVLGDLRDLSMQAGLWVQAEEIDAPDRRVDEFAFVLAGVGLVLADERAQEGASVVLSARRAKKLDPELQRYLQRRLYQAAPPTRLRRELEGVFAGELGMGSNGPAVAQAFRDAADTGALRSFAADMHVISDIAQETSAQSAVTLLARVRDGADLRRARLVAQAGGDLAVALAGLDEGDFLDVARTNVNWGQSLYLQLASLLACAALLVLLAGNVFLRSFGRGEKQHSAVYAYRARL